MSIEQIGAERRSPTDVKYVRSEQIYGNRSAFAPLNANPSNSRLVDYSPDDRRDVQTD